MEKQSLVIKGSVTGVPYGTLRRRTFCRDGFRDGSGPWKMWFKGYASFYEFTQAKAQVV